MTIFHWNPSWAMIIVALWSVWSAWTWAYLTRKFMKEIVFQWNCRTKSWVEVASTKQNINMIFERCKVKVAKCYCINKYGFVMMKMLSFHVFHWIVSCYVMSLQFTFLYFISLWVFYSQKFLHEKLVIIEIL